MTQVKFSRRPLHNGFTHLVDDLFADLPVLFREAGNKTSSIPVNISSDEQGYRLEIFAPGFEKSDFQVGVDQQLLTVAADRKTEEKNEQVKQIRREYQVNSFRRTFTIDDKFNVDGIEAKYVNGVLTLNLPRKEEVKPSSKVISIQ
jgi:HSP20 family protein